MSGVHTTIARCLLEPGYLDRVRAGELPLSAEAEGLDLDRLRMFGGFVSKVQHNDSWADFPFTRAALKLAGREIDTFADYRNRHLTLGAVPGLPRVERIRALIGFIEQRFGQDGSRGASQAVTIVRHERALWEVRLALELPAEQLDRQIVPRDVLRVVELAHDPQVIADQIRVGAAAWAEVAAQPRFVCYWGQRAEHRLTTVAVDGVTALVLSEIGTGIDPDALIARLAGYDDRFTEPVVSAVLAGAADRGMIRLVEPARLR